MAKIFIVDDDATIVTLYREILHSAGYEVISASSGKEALAMAIHERPDLILLDVMMPEKDGAETGAELLANYKTKNIPVIFLTSMVTEAEVAQADGTIGGRQYLSKTMPKKLILERIREVLSSTAGGRGPNSDSL